MMRITKPRQICKKSPWASCLVVKTNIITSRILPHLCGLKELVSESQCSLQPHEQSLERAAFCRPCEGLCPGERLLGFELGVGDTHQEGHGARRGLSSHLGSCVVPAGEAQLATSTGSHRLGLLWCDLQPPLDRRLSTVVVFPTLLRGHTSRFSFLVTS